MSKIVLAPVGFRKAVPLVLALALVFGWSTITYAQTPADAQYESPTATASGNPAVSGNQPGPASPDGDLTSNGSGLLGVSLRLLEAVAGVGASLYVVFRVRPGVSLYLQRRALLFLALGGLLFASTQLFDILEMLASPGTYLTLGRFAIEAAVVVCLVIVGYLLRRSELDEIGPLRRSANLDPLTALYNQPFFRRAASRRTTLAKLHDIPLSLAMLDVDDFKEYNDRFGHEAGNVVLRCVAGVLRRSVRADDLVARYGGEEFVMLLNSEPRKAEEALERIRSQIEGRCSPGSGPVRQQVTVSIGVAALDDQTQTVEGLIEAADEAMYRAKNAGKNRVIGSEETA